MTLQWILDFLVCNGLGIWLGIKTSQYLEMKAYHWRGLWKIPTLKYVFTLRIKIHTCLSTCNMYIFCFCWWYSFQGEVEACCLAVHSLLLDWLPVGLHRVFHSICLCLPDDFVCECNQYYSYCFIAAQLYFSVALARTECFLLEDHLVDTTQPFLKPLSRNSVCI